jgi:hypothetical protein
VIEEVTRALAERAQSPAASRGVAPTAQDLPVAGFRPTVAPPGISIVSEVREGIMQFLPDDEPIGRSLQLLGEWQHGALAFLARFVRLGQTMLEVGASVGAHGIALSRMLGSDGHLFAFEDDGIRRRLLAQNFSYNKVTNATILTLPRRDGAVGDVAFECDLDVVGIEDLDWIKFNDEASWRAITSESSDYIWRVRPRFISFHDDASAARSAAETMDDLGYRGWSLEVPYFNPRNFNNNTDNVFADRSVQMLISIPESVAMDVDMAPAQAL